MSLRWTNLFADLEGQLAHELEAEELELRGEEERLRLGRMSLRDRLEAARADGALTMTLLSGRALTVRIATTGRDWLAGDVIDESSRQSQVVVPLSAVSGLVLSESQVMGSVRAVQPDGRELTTRLGLAFVLRDFARRRRAVDVVSVDAEFHGTIDRVGRDHFDIAIHEPDTPRRQSAVSQFRVVLFSQLLFVRLR